MPWCTVKVMHALSYSCTHLYQLLVSYDIILKQAVPQKTCELDHPASQGSQQSAQDAILYQKPWHSL